MNIIKRIAALLSRAGASRRFAAIWNMNGTVVDAATFAKLSGYVPMSSCPEIRICAHTYADMISNMTIHLMRSTDKGDVREKNELSRLIDIEPNSHMNRKQLIYSVVYSMLLSGDGNAVLLPRFEEGFLRELVPVPPAAVKFEGVGLGYVVKIGELTYDPSEIIHVAMNPDPNCPWLGTGFRLQLRDAVRCLSQANATKSALMESPAPSIIVKVDGLTDEYASPDGQKKLNEKFVESRESGEPWFIPAEAFAVEQVKPLTLSDLAIKDNIELDRRTIAALFGIPAFMVGVGKFEEEEYNNFITSRIMGVAKYIEQEFTRKLLYSKDLYFKFNPRSLYNYKLTELITAGGEMVDRMAMRRNEWRDWVGLTPDDEMDDLLALENYIPADKLGDQKKLNP